MMPGEAWTLAPCEISRWLHVRGVHAEDEQLFMGIIIAKAFNKPSLLVDEVRERRQLRQAVRRPTTSTMDELVGMFRGAGVRVVEKDAPAMSAVIGGISVYLEDDTARFQQSMLRNASLVEQQTQRMTRALEGTAKSVDELNRRASGFTPNAFKALATDALRAESSIDRLKSTMLAVVALAGGGARRRRLRRGVRDEGARRHS